LDDRSSTLDWRERLRPSQTPARPFNFHLPGGEKSRKVDGTIRRELAELFMNRWSSQREFLTVEKRAQRLLRTADLTIWLPNAEDNLQGPANQLRDNTALRARVAEE